MLALSNNATEAIEGILNASSVPDGAGVRIAPSPDVDGAPGVKFQVTVAASPAETDQVIDDTAARVFVDETAAGFLDDKLLDASVVQDDVRFTLESQSQ